MATKKPTWTVGSDLITSLLYVYSTKESNVLWGATGTSCTYTW